MADNDKVIVQVDADTKDATEKLNALKAKLEEASKAIQERRQGKASRVPTFRYTEEDGWTPNGKKRSLEDIRGKIREQIEKQKQEEAITTDTPQEPQGGTKGSDKETGLAINDSNTPSAFGKEAGRIFTAVFFSRMAQRGIDLWATYKRHPLTNNRNIDIAQETLSAAQQGASETGFYGAQIGARFGVKGAIIGALVGAVGGGVVSGLMGYNKSKTELEKRDELARYNLATDRRSFEYQKRNANASVADSMFDSIGLRSTKIEHYTEQMQNLMTGKDGITDLQQKLERMTDGRQDTPQYQRLQQMLAQKQSQYLEYQQKQAMLELDQPFKRFESGDLSDSYAKQGVFVGNQVDIGNLQQQQIDYVRNILNAVREIVTGVNTITQGDLGAIDSTRPRAQLESANS